jgi:DNA-binding response OmpR family regulator
MLTSSQSHTSQELPKVIVSKIWYLTPHGRELMLGDCTIRLTLSESKIVSLFLSSQGRIASNESIAAELNRINGNYTGLPMIMSRLQRKFSTASGGEKLFRAVRNRGYCLIQELRQSTSKTS